MKLLICGIILFYFTNISAQFNQFPKENQGNISGGLGLNWIDDELHYTFHFTPEVSFANFGVGLDLRLDFDSKGNVRKENFNEFSDYLSIIRYARYGLKNDPVFIKLGALDYYTLGHGSIIYQYNNSPSFDARKTGLVADIDFGKFGFESIYSTFGEAGLIGLRGYTRPLQFSEYSDLPVIGNLEVGVSIASDFNRYAGVTSGHYVRSTNDFVIDANEGSISIFGIDLGLPVLTNDLVNIELYLDYAKILKFGSGVTTGAMFEFNGLGLVNISAKLERRFNDGQFMPAYFNSFYEIERFRADTSLSVGFESKARKLAAIYDAENGFFGQLGVSVLGMFDIIGSYQRLDKKPESGIFHMSTEIAPKEAPFVLRAGYDKIEIKNEKDLFTLDDRSFLNFELGYKPVEYILVSLVYIWTYSPVRDDDNRVIGFAPQKRVEPRVSFIFPVDLKGGR